MANMSSELVESLAGRKRRHSEQDAITAAIADADPEDEERVGPSVAKAPRLSNRDDSGAAAEPPQPQQQDEQPQRQQQQSQQQQPPQQQSGKNLSLPDGRRWARQQVKDAIPYQREELGDYNIWFHRSTNQFKERGLNKAHAATQCHPELDSGLTRGDIEKQGATAICLHFARGCCVNGARCTFLHRLPTAADCARLDPFYDVFGRKRMATEREDMDGIGCFNRDSRTLYVAGVAHLQASDCAARVAKHFGIWGPLEQISVKPRHRCVFVTFRHRAYAEFAKVAMAEQSLDHDESLRVRWAYDDPNPAAIAQKARDTQELAIQKVQDYLYARGELPGADDPVAVAAEYNPGAEGAGEELYVHGGGQRSFGEGGDGKPQSGLNGAAPVGSEGGRGPLSSAGASGLATATAPAASDPAALHVHYQYYATHYQPLGWSWEQYWVYANQPRHLAAGSAALIGSGSGSGPGSAPNTGPAPGPGLVGPATASQHQAAELQEAASSFNALLDMIDAHKPRREPEAPPEVK